MDNFQIKIVIFFIHKLWVTKYLFIDKWIFFGLKHAFVSLWYCAEVGLESDSLTILVWGYISINRFKLMKKSNSIFMG